MSSLRCFSLALSALFLLVFASSASAAPGDLDPSFGSGGMVKLLESNEESWAEGIAVQPDGKIVIAGQEKGNAVVLRLLPNGQPDLGFGSGGKVTLTPGGFSELRAVALQPDGKIVAAGEAEVAGNVDFLIVRLNPDGSPDLGFGGGDGIETVPVGAEEDDAEAVAIGPGGRIVASGVAETPGNEETAAVVVLRSNGTPDPSFGGGDGSLAKETESGEDRGVAVAMLADGSILLADENGAGAGDGFTLMKLQPDGEYDKSFGEGDGIALTPIPAVEAPEMVTPAGRITDFAVLPDGRIIASGYGLDIFGEPPNSHLTFAAVRYLANGELDKSFAKEGIFFRRIGNDEAAASAVALAQGGGYLFAGTYQLESVKESAGWVARLKPDGTPDPAFGSNGFAFRTETAPFGEYVEKATVDSADRLLTIGSAFGPNNTEWVSVTRYFGDPQPPIAIPISTPVANLPAHAKMKAVPKKLALGKLKGFSGTASDPDGNGVQKVQIALVKRARGGVKAKASAARASCFALNAKLRFKRTKAKKNQCPQVWLNAKGTSKWSFELKGVLPPGKYVVFARAVDGKGLAETKFSRKLRNRYGFRVVAARPR